MFPIIIRRSVVCDNYAKYGDSEMVRVSESGNERRGLTCDKTNTQIRYIIIQSMELAKTRSVKIRFLLRNNITQIISLYNT